MEEGVKQLFRPKKKKIHFSIWTWIYDPIQPRTERERGERPFPSPSLRNPLLYAAFLGLRSVMEYLIIERSQDVDSRAVDEGQPLYIWLRGKVM